jgi:hypothetical protein
MSTPVFDEVAAWIRRSEIGRSAAIASPFGERRLFYADLTASGRALSFVVRGRGDPPLVCERSQLALARDLTGIGCSGSARTRSERYRRFIHAGLGGAKPGWVRLSVPYCASENDVEYVLSAVEAVADHGDAFVPRYRLSCRDGSWTPLTGSSPAPAHLQRLEDLWRTLDAPAANPPAPDDAELARDRSRFLAEVRALGSALRARWREQPPAWNRPTGNAELAALGRFRYVATDGLS